MDRALTVNGDNVEADATFEQLFVGHRDEIFAYVCRVIGDRQQAEDLTQDTFVKAYRALGHLPTDANVRAWLYRIATNAAVDWLRRRRLISWLPLFERGKYPANHTSFVEGSLESLVVQRVLARLPVRYSVPLVLYSCQGFSTQEIAAILGISRGAVKSRLFRARTKFRRLYAREEIES
jgi:RNA polymerase sigma-70 factor (ECF subfamily)